MKNFLFISFFWLSVTSLVQAEDAGLMFSPAHFGKGPDSFLSKLACPVQQDDREIAGVFCQIEVAENGEVVDDDTLSFCFGPSPSDLEYVKITEAALAKSKFQPAMVAGVSKKVTVLLRVLFGYQNGSCQYTALLNWGYQQKEFGLDYSSPQKISLSGGQVAQHESGAKGLFSKSSYSDDKIMSRLSLMVSDTGAVSDAKAEEKKRAYEKETEHALSILKGAHFIPGFYKNKPQSMRYNELLFMDHLNKGRVGYGMSGSFLSGGAVKVNP